MDNTNDKPKTLNDKLLKLSKKITLSFLLFLILVGITIDVQAQRRKVLNLPSYDESPYHFGFILGINNMLFSINTADNLPNKKWSTDQSPDVYGDSLYVYSNIQFNTWFFCGNISKPEDG